MSKEDIIEGLKAAVGKGESLNKVMMSFYNSGYPKEDIEDSAIDINAPKMPQTNIPSRLASMPTMSLTNSLLASKQSVNQIQQGSESSSQKEVRKSTSSPVSEQESYSEEAAYQEYPSLQQTQNVQKISKYGEKPSPLGAVMVFILVFFLLFLIGALISVFLFKDNLAIFFNNFIK